MAALDLRYTDEPKPETKHVFNCAVSARLSCVFPAVITEDKTAN